MKKGRGAASRDVVLFSIMYISESGCAAIVGAMIPIGIHIITKFSLESDNPSKSEDIALQLYDLSAFLIRHEWIRINYDQWLHPDYENSYTTRNAFAIHCESGLGSAGDYDSIPSIKVSHPRLTETIDTRTFADLAAENNQGTHNATWIEKAPKMAGNGVYSVYTCKPDR